MAERRQGLAGHDVSEAAREFLDCLRQGRVGVDVQMPRDVDDHEQHVAELGALLRRGARFLELGDFLVELGP